MSPTTHFTLADHARRASDGDTGDGQVYPGWWDGTGTMGPGTGILGSITIGTAPGPGSCSWPWLLTHSHVSDLSNP